MIPTQDVSWTDIESLVEKLSENILKLSRNFSSITTLSRGGLVPSRLLADSLGIKKIFVDQPLFLLILCLWMIFLILVKHLIMYFHVLMINLNLFLLLYLQDVVSQYPEQLIYGEKTLDNSYVVFPWDKLEFKNSIQ